MENILDSLEIDWVKTQEPYQEITANVIYISTYICFTLVKVINPSITGDVYRLTMPYPIISFTVRLFINKLACAGIRFMFQTNNIYTIDPSETELRIRNETTPLFEVDNIFEDDPEALDDAMFDSMQETFNNYHYTRGRYDPTNNIFEMGMYFKNWHKINANYFATDDRWVTIGMVMLRVAKISRQEALSAVIIYNINEILSRLGASADINFIKAAKTFASRNTSNKLLERWNHKLLDTIESYNLIFYEI
jgi:hypothetical protein